MAGFDRSIFHLGDHLNDPDLPFLFEQLLPWMSLEEFQRAKLQLKNSIEENEELIAHRLVPYNPRLLQAFSNVFDAAITKLQLFQLFLFCCFLEPFDGLPDVVYGLVDLSIVSVF